MGKLKIPNFLLPESNPRPAKKKKSWIIFEFFFCSFLDIQIFIKTRWVFLKGLEAISLRYRHNKNKH